MDIREGDAALCMVRKIEGTSVFLEIEECPLMGSMVLSEVAAGRIRNLGDYVSKGKKIVCKVLKVSKDHVELSLRRVSSKEREEVLDWHQKARAFRRILESSVKNSGDIIEKIIKDYDLVDFVEQGREKPEIFEKYLGKEDAKKILLMIKEKAEKEKVVKKIFMVKSLSNSGISDMKQILDVDGEIHYRGSSIFSISISGKDFKEAEHKLEISLNEIEKRAKEKKAEFEILKGK